MIDILLAFSLSFQDIPEGFVLEPPPLNEDGYLCITNDAIGFNFRDGEWSPTTLIVDEMRFVVRLADTEATFGPNEGWVIYRFGEEYATSSCDVPEFAIMRCRGLRGLYQIDIEDLRFTRQMAFGYLMEPEATSASDPYPPDTMLVAYGDCTPL